MYERIKIQLKSEDAKRIVSFFVQPHSAGWLFSVYNYISTDFYFEIVIYMGKVYWKWSSSRKTFLTKPRPVICILAPKIHFISYGSTDLFPFNAVLNAIKLIWFTVCWIIRFFHDPRFGALNKRYVFFFSENCLIWGLL